MRGILAVLWGLLGVNLLLLSAVYRLSLRATEAFSQHLGAVHWTMLVVGVAAMAYMEGYRGFQKAFSPRVAARALFLRRHGNALEAVLAPFFLMGYFGATRRRKIVSISLTLGIIGLILLVRLLPQPWRGLLDIGVVVGLGWGIASLWWFTARAFSSPDFDHPPEVPPERLGGTPAAFEAVKGST